MADWLKSLIKLGSRHRGKQSAVVNKAIDVLEDLLIGKKVRAAIGAWHDVAFVVSSFKVLTFDDWQRTTKARYAKHDVIGVKPLLEYIGADLQEISLTVQLNSALGVSPSVEMNKLRAAIETGVADYLIVGNQVIASPSMWVIEEMTEKVIHWDGSGGVIVSTLELKFKEYC